MIVTVKIEMPELRRSYERSQEFRHAGYFEKLKAALDLALDWYELHSEKVAREVEESLK